jgi:hypothetical protein
MSDDLLYIRNPEVETDLPCTRCGYNLRRLPIFGRCPECGFPVAGSLPDRFRIPEAGRIAAALQQAARGWTVIAATIAVAVLGGIMLVPLLAVFAGDALSIPPLMVWTSTAALGVFAGKAVCAHARLRLARITADPTFAGFGGLRNAANVSAGLGLMSLMPEGYNGVLLALAMFGVSLHSLWPMWAIIAAATAADLIAYAVCCRRLAVAADEHEFAEQFAFPIQVTATGAGLVAVGLLLGATLHAGWSAPAAVIPMVLGAAAFPITIARLAELTDKLAFILLAGRDTSRSNRAGAAGRPGAVAPPAPALPAAAPAGSTPPPADAGIRFVDEIRFPDTDGPPAPARTLPRPEVVYLEPTGVAERPDPS